MNKILIIFIILLASGCASRGRKEQLAIRELYKNKQFESALESLNKSQLKKEEKNQLLYLMEKGKILFSEGKYSAASDIFHEANNLVDKLYTKKITQKILSSIGNDNSENYYGSILERSMLYYYLAQSNLKIYNQRFIQKKVIGKEGKVTWEKSNISTNEARQHLFRARASVVAWNGFFEEVRRVNKETTLYQSDLMGKLFAASIHELVAQRSDINIAINLYNDALKILEIQGPSYKQFNNKFKVYTQNIYDQIEKGKFKPDQTWIESTDEYQKARDFIHFKLLGLIKKYQSRSYKSKLNALKPAKEVLKRLNEKELPNTTILVETSLTNPMEAQEFDYSLNSAIEKIENQTTKALVEGIGLPILTIFAMGPLGLGYATQTGNTYIYTQHNLGTTVMRHIGIGFEMPIVKEVPLEGPMSLNVYKKEKETKKLVKSYPLAITSPVNDLAMQAASERAQASFTKVGVRVALKHVVAILAAFKTYESMKEQGEFLARTLAYTQYMASSRAIAASEQADIRFWSTLPATIRQSSFYLPQGEYEITAQHNGVKESEKSLGFITVNAKEKNFFSYQL